ncbi:MAG: hypothetical protein V4541_13105 [Bacteroidota bacterium]
MKRSIIFLALFTLITLTFTACEKRDYPGGLPEYENVYYAGFLPWNNTTTSSVPRTQTTLIKFPVEFHSVYVRDYDAVANYSLVSAGIAAPAIEGQDFVVTDKNGAALTSAAGKFSLVFPQAKAKVDTIYLKVLNSAIPGTRKIEIDIIPNNGDQYSVHNFSQAYKRFLEVK